MALSTATMRGLIRKYGMRAFEKVVIYPDDTTPVYEPLFIRPTEVPSGTLAEGAIWFDDDNHTIAFYNGTANVEVVTTSSTGDLTITDDLNVGDDINMTSTGAILTMGPAATDPITLTQSANTLTLGSGDTFVADDITINDDLTLNSAGAIISIGDGANAVTLTHSTNTLTVGSGDTLAVTSNATVGGTLAVTGATNYKKQVTDTGGAFATPIVLTTAQSGRVLMLDDAAGLDFTLPAIGASDVGTFFRFVCTVSCTSNSYRITAGAADLLKGAVTMVDFDAAYTAPQAVFIEPDGTDDLIMTMNGSTTGGKIGTDIEFLAISATEWFVSGIVGADGTIATPFS